MVGTSRESRMLRRCTGPTLSVSSPAGDKASRAARMASALLRSCSLIQLDQSNSNPLQIGVRRPLRLFPQTVPNLGLREHVRRPAFTTAVETRCAAIRRTNVARIVPQRIPNRHGAIRMGVYDQSFPAAWSRIHPSCDQFAFRSKGRPNQRTLVSIVAGARTDRGLAGNPTVNRGLTS